MQHIRPPFQSLFSGIVVLAAIPFFFYPVPTREARGEGKPPYEMTEAGRTRDSRPPLIDFQNVDSWTVEPIGSEASFETVTERRLFGDRVAKLTYKLIPSDKPAAPSVVLKPADPLPLPEKLDCIRFWVYGNNWSWEDDAGTPRVSVALLLRTEKDRQVRIHLDTVRWKEWFLIRRKLNPEQLRSLGPSPRLEGIEIAGGTNREPRTLYFSNLAFYTEELKPLSFPPRPKRGIDLPPGQDPGLNTGPDRLPFPNRDETLLPDSNRGGKNTVTENKETGDFMFQYQGPDGTLRWRYAPKTGSLDDLSFAWQGAVRREFGFRGAGVTFAEAPPDEPARPESVRIEGDSVRALWNLGREKIEYRLQMKGKTLIVDLRCPGGNVDRVSLGEILGTENPRFVQVPYLTGRGTQRPEVLLDGSREATLFFLPTFDHTRSGASELLFDNRIEQGTVTAAAGALYKTKTDGTRNDCHERLFLTLSPVFEEVLPNIPNDPSPWREVTARHVWRAHGSTNHEKDFEYWKRVRRYGLSRILITDHETMWRDGGESFTFRTSAAPGRGGDRGHAEYTRNIRSLGYVYGPYNNYTDFAPVNAYWDEDRVTRLPDGNFAPAWARCYNPKPSVAVALEPEITEIVQKKFNFNTAYCDVHTAVTPWQYVDYDARVPGAGTFAATYYAYGEIMLHQKKVWGGPVYSEGANHWYYSGLTDGNYAQDQAYFVRQNGLPWLVDFDLLKIHPKENNFGMGYMAMFYGNRYLRDLTDRRRQEALDRFLAATLAFGHTGFLAMETGMAGGVRAYFALQQVAARYGTQQVDSIRYADEQGRFLTTSQALAEDRIGLNRIRVRYEDGLTIYVNGHPDRSWNCLDEDFITTIPPNGWFVRGGDDLTAWSLLRDGKRADYVDSPEYLFAQVRDNPPGEPCRFDRLLCDAQLIVLKNVDEKGRWEMIVGQSDYSARSRLHAVRLDGDRDADAVALDFQRKELGPAETRYARGMVHVMPVEGAFSYLLSPKEPVAAPDNVPVKVVPGETVIVGEASCTIPPDTPFGTLYWHEKDGVLHDFQVLAPCAVSARFDPARNVIAMTIRSNLPGSSIRYALFRDEKEIAKGGPDDMETMCVSKSEIPKRPESAALRLRVDVAREGFETHFTKEYYLKTDYDYMPVPSVPDRFETGFCLRGGRRSALDAKSGAYAYMDTVFCGVRARKAWAIHPPYRGGVGYTFMLSEPITIPDEPGIVFESEVGIRNGGDASDGVLYRVLVVEGEDVETPVGEILWDKRDWGPLVCDLEPWRGKTVRLRLIADVGPKDNSGADWACWSNFRFRATRLSLRTTLHEEPVRPTYRVLETPILALDELTGAEKVELVYEGCGMDASDRYHSVATLNGVPLGRLPGAWGDETKGVWATTAVTLPAEAVRSLDRVNRLEIRSDEDCFKVRSFRLVATRSDGTKRSTLITDRTITHPTGWRYAEGETVPMKTPIVLDILYRNPLYD